MPPLNLSPFDLTAVQIAKSQIVDKQLAYNNEATAYKINIQGDG